MSAVDDGSSVNDDARDNAVDRLRDEFRGIHGETTIQRFVDEAISAFAGARIKNYVELFVRRFARERLRALAQVQGGIVKDVPEVLFVCVHDPGRSEMAASLLDRHANGQVHVRSAGSMLTDETDPRVVQVMAELGVELADAFPKPLTDEFIRAADVVITIGCAEACPIYPDKRYEDWQVDDPAGESLLDVRHIRDSIDARTRQLLESLIPLNSAPDERG